MEIKRNKGKWAPGQSGNPAGREPHVKTGSELAHELGQSNNIVVSYTVKKGGEEKTEEISIKSDKSIEIGMWLATFVEGLKGNFKAFELYLNRVYGKPPQLDAEGDGDDLMRLLSRIPKSELKSQIDDIRSRRLLPGNTGS